MFSCSPVVSDSAFTASAGFALLSVIHMEKGLYFLLCPQWVLSLSLSPSSEIRGLGNGWGTDPSDWVGLGRV